MKIGPNSVHNSPEIPNQPQIFYGYATALGHKIHCLLDKDNKIRFWN